MMKINVGACSYRVSDHSVFTPYIMKFFNYVGEHKQQSMKEQTIAVHKRPVHAFCIHHLQQKHIQVTKRSEICAKTAKP